MVNLLNNALLVQPLELKSSKGNDISSCFEVRTSDPKGFDHQKRNLCEKSGSSTEASNQVFEDETD